jgi:hypothetical protein
MIIRVHLTDGSVHSFEQDDSSKEESIWQSIDALHLFAQPHLVVAGAFSKSVFVPSEVVRIDFVRHDRACWGFPEGYSDVVELSEADFRKLARLDEPHKMPRRDQPTPAGDLLVSFLKLQFRSGSPIYIMAEFSVKLPAENQSFMRFLLSKTGFHMRLPTGGAAVVNLATLVGYTVYPGVAQVPGNAWLAEPR